jgi:hypothetical protein
VPRKKHSRQQTIICHLPPVFSWKYKGRERGLHQMVKNVYDLVQLSGGADIPARPNGVPFKKTFPSCQATSVADRNVRAPGKHYGQECPRSQCP